MDGKSHSACRRYERGGKRSAVYILRFIKRRISVNLYLITRRHKVELLTVIGEKEGIASIVNSADGKYFIHIRRIVI